MASQSNQRTFAEKAGLWLKVQKQQQQQQQRQQHPVEQQHYEQLHQKPQQQQLALCDPMKVMTFAETAELWFKTQQSQLQRKHDQQYSQEQQQKQQLQQQKVQTPDSTRQGPIQTQGMTGHGSIQTPDLTGQVPIQTPGLIGQGPIQTPDLTGQGPIQTPDPTGQGPIQTPDLTGQGPIQTPDPTGHVPIQTSDPTGQGPIQTPDPTGQGTIQTPDPTGQGPIQTPDPTGQDLIQTPGLTGQDLISANKVSLSQTPDAHGQGRLSAHVTPGQAYSKDHFQQHPQQHTGEAERQPRDSLLDLPQSSLEPDVMSIAPPVPHLQKRTWPTKTSSTIFAYNAAEASVRQDINDGSHPEKYKITPLNAVGKEKHEEDETKQRSVETKGRLPQQELHKYVLEPSMTLSTFEEQIVVVPKTPRRGRIISLKVEEMEKYIGGYIGKGSFGTVYRAKMTAEDDRKFAIKSINVTNEVFQKSYEKEISSGRILHHFINPIIARAEDLSKSVVYLMYPLMENLDLRHNIDLEKAGKKLDTKGDESNSRIWTRCIYQIAHAVDYLHKPVNSSFRFHWLEKSFFYWQQEITLWHLSWIDQESPGYRGPIFHQDLTSHNILLDGHFNVKIGDFGMAVEAKKGAPSATMSTIKQPREYHPPKMNQLKYTASYDIFSVGVVMLEILTAENAKLEGEPEYLYEKYVCQGGDRDLIEDLDKRTTESAKWINRERRDALAKLALEAVDQNDDKRERFNLLQKLDEMKLNRQERYQWPSNLDRCVSCYINPLAKLPLKGKDCARSNIKSACRPFCLPCLMNNHNNPLVCPQHGKTRPPFGDHVYGVFVAGNNVKGMEQFSYNTEAVAQTFIKDTGKVVQVLTTKYPFVLGASAEHLKIVKADNPGQDVNMETSIRAAFDNMNFTIKKALQDNNQNPDTDILQNSLFIFYFSGHCSKENGLYLGNAEETLKALENETQNATTKFIMEMLHEKLRVDHVLVILDCCHAGSQHFDQYHKKNVHTVLQLSSCDINERSIVKSEGSLFTNFLCLGLQGSLELEGGKINCCTECKKQNKTNSEKNIELPCVKYHYDCVSDNGVTYTSLKDFIEGHFDLLRADKTSNLETMTPVNRAQGENKFFIAYYSPSKSHITIHLKGSTANHVYCLSSHLESMDKLRKDIISYTQSGAGDISCDVLTFHKSYGQESYRLIAIHVMYGKDKYEELPSLESIEKAWSCGHELVACVREDVQRLSHGPVKLNYISKSMVPSSLENSDSENLKINQDCIEIARGMVLEAEEELRTIKQSESGLHENFLSLIDEVLNITRKIRNVKLMEKINGNVLRFCLYDDFSVLDIQ